MTLKVVFFGTPQFAVPCLEALLQNDRFEVMGCVSQPDKRRGRGNKTTPSPVKAVAVEHGLTVWQPTRIKKDPDTLEQLDALQADIFVVVAYGQILSKQILAMPRLGCVNVHGSLLPEYRGAAPIQWSIVHGKCETGVTTMQMDEGMDTGDMLLVSKMPIGPEDTAWTVAERMSALGAETLVETLLKLDSGTVTAQPQKEEEATYAPLIKKADYGLDWSKGSVDLHNQVRGFYPNCVCNFREGPLKILETVPLNQPNLDWSENVQSIFQVWEVLQSTTGVAKPGEIVALIKGKGPVVQTENGVLLLLQVKPAGKKAMSGWDFVNGLRVEMGEKMS